MFIETFKSGEGATPAGVEFHTQAFISINKLIPEGSFPYKKQKGELLSEVPLLSFTIQPIYLKISFSITVSFPDFTFTIYNPAGSVI
jgi:hypothetical protein